jgi:hypothetical protein
MRTGERNRTNVTGLLDRFSNWIIHVPIEPDMIICTLPPRSSACRPERALKLDRPESKSPHRSKAMQSRQPSRRVWRRSTMRTGLTEMPEERVSTQDPQMIPLHIRGMREYDHGVGFVSLTYPEGASTSRSLPCQRTESLQRLRSKTA